MSRAQLRPCQQCEDELPTAPKTTSQTPAPKASEPSGTALQQLPEQPLHVSPLQICSAFDGPCWNLFKEGQKPGRAEGAAEGISEHKTSLKTRPGGGERSPGKNVRGWASCWGWAQPTAGHCGQRCLAPDPPEPWVPPGCGWKPDAEPRAEAGDHQGNLKGPLVLRRPWLFRTPASSRVGTSAVGSQ